MSVFITELIPNFAGFLSIKQLVNFLNATNQKLDQKILIELPTKTLKVLARSAVIHGLSEKVEWFLARSLLEKNWVIQRAAKSGHLEIVKLLLKQDIELRYIGLSIEHAAKNGHLSIVEYMIQLDISPLDKNWTFVKAVEGGHLPIVEFMINHVKHPRFVNLGFTKAAFDGNVAIVKYLLKHDIPLEYIQRGFIEARIKNHKNVVECLERYLWI